MFPVIIIYSFLFFFFPHHKSFSYSVILSLIWKIIAIIVVHAGNGNTHRIHHCKITSHSLAIPNRSNWLGLVQMHHLPSTTQMPHRITTARVDTLTLGKRGKESALCIWETTHFSSTHKYCYHLSLLFFCFKSTNDLSNFDQTKSCSVSVNACFEYSVKKIERIKMN